MRCGGGPKWIRKILNITRRQQQYRSRRRKPQNERNTYLFPLFVLHYYHRLPFHIKKKKTERQISPSHAMEHWIHCEWCVRCAVSHGCGRARVCVCVCECQRVWYSTIRTLNTIGTREAIRALFSIPQKRRFIIIIYISLSSYWVMWYARWVPILFTQPMHEWLSAHRDKSYRTSSSSSKLGIQWIRQLKMWRTHAHHKKSVGTSWQTVESVISKTRIHHTSFELILNITNRQLFTCAVFRVS